MAPVELDSTASLIPTLTRASHLLLSVVLSTIVGRTIYRSYLTLPPSSTTRSRGPLRQTHVKLFSALAALSLITATYYGTSIAQLSYRVWADERGVELPDSWFGDKGAFRGGVHPGRVHLVQWLNDTSFYRSTYELVAEKARYIWWGQQASLATTVWSNFLAIEGRRRGISHLWAFLLLAQLVGLSYAQNLFFVATLLTPVPLPDNVKDMTRDSVLATSSRLRHLKNRLISPKPEGWLPHPAFYITTLLASTTATFLSPYATRWSSFNTTILISQFLPSLPLLLPEILPQSLGKIHKNPHAAQKSHRTLFRTMAILSTLLHAKTSTVAVLTNTPSDSYHDPTLFHPFNSTHRSTLERGSKAISRLLGAINEHPVISSLGYDVLLSSLSLGLWAGVRNLDPMDMLLASSPLETETKQAKVKAKEEAASPLPKRRGRGRPKKEDMEYKPEPEELVAEGDEEAADPDWEAAALAWGLISATGLGSGSSGIFGAECVAR
ncbi:hypothetical protein PVAG01_04038 [Phlyctema vagabunda]|uniref:Uncharacterized protein n=1 Tax=Phlyctema vagabunda TaxID=108571 RepID=A0ABR4PN31_9HELO